MKSSFVRVVCPIIVVLSAISSSALASSNSRLPEDAQFTGRLAPASNVTFALTLPIRDQAGLSDFLSRVYDPSDPTFHQFLTPAEFADRFGPTAADYAALRDLAVIHGFTVTREFKSRLVLDVSGPSSAAEALFGVRLQAYRDSAGRQYRVPDIEPRVPADLQALQANVVGLDDLPAAHCHMQRSPEYRPSGSPVGMTPSELRTAYNIPSIDGAGQSVGLMELDGYVPGDIANFKNEFGLGDAPLVNVPVDGATNVAGSGASEVVLDIDMALTMASGASAIHVYQAPNTDQGDLDCFTTIADDNQDKVASTSWGEAEIEMSTNGMEAENTVFQQMAAQGQSMFAAAGDDGAYDNYPTDPNTLCVDDPGSQPYVTCCGGTTLSTSGSGGWLSEVVWNDGQGDATGGGVSQQWAMPSYQQAAGLSGAFRLVPDVALNGDPNTGYAIYFSDPQNGAGWYEFGGTSSDAPLWAGFTALLNQQLASRSESPIGFLSPSIYSLAKSSSYSSTFHDITSGNNLFYDAGPGYDECTGWGSMNGENLIASLAGTVSTLAVPTGLTATAGNSQVLLSWTASSGATAYNIYRGTSSGGLGTTPIATGLSGIDYTDSGLTNGDTYYYDITAVNASGTSGPSNEASAIPVAPIPALPTGLVATPSNGQVTLSWTATANATSYSVYRGTSSGTENAAPIETAITGTTFTNLGLIDGNTYYYEIASVDASGTSARSAEVSATPTSPVSGAPPAPTGLSAVAGNGSATLTWSAAIGAVTYNVYQGNSPGGELQLPEAALIAGTSYTVTGLTNGGTYYFTVAAVDASGTSQWSNEASAAPMSVTAPALHTFAAGLQMISAPTNDSDLSVSTIFNQSGVSLAVWDPALLVYAVSPNPPANTLVPAQGYWAFFTSETSLMDVGSDASVSTSYPITLPVGWNIIGNPRSTAISLATLTVQAGLTSESFSQANTAGVIGDALYTYGPTDTQYAIQVGTNSTLEPYAGYWIYVSQPCTLTFPASE